MRGLWTVLGVAGCAGVGGPETESCLPGGTPTLEIGRGAEGYEPIAEGGPFPLIHGPQGGYHLEIGLRATHLDASELLVAHLEGEVDGQVHATADTWLDFRCEPAQDALFSWGTLLIYDLTGPELDGRTTRISVEVDDASGQTVSASAEFVIESDG